MADPTVVRRVKRQRDVRLAEGWQEVRVWVPTEQDANDIRNLAADRRAKAKALAGLDEGIKSMPPETLHRIAEAIASQGSAAYTTPSGPVLDLLTKLAEEDDLASFSRAFILLARAEPANAAFVAGAVPAKISNFLIKHRGVKATALIKWTESNPDWAEKLKNALRDPDLFVRVIEGFASAIKQGAAAH
ncbi:hypothetical protein ACVWYQ_003762 [Bradyrhizobium sp. USDA 3397]